MYFLRVLGVPSGRSIGSSMYFLRELGVPSGLAPRQYNTIYTWTAEGRVVRPDSTRPPNIRGRDELDILP